MGDLRHGINGAYNPMLIKVKVDKHRRA